MKQLAIYLDGTEQEITVRYGDRLRAEREMTAHGYGTPQHAPGTWLSLATFRAAVRDGLTEIKDFEAWTDSLDDLQAITEDEAESDQSFGLAPSTEA